MYPFLASVINLPPHIRTRLGPSSLLCLAPGTYAKGETVDVDCVLDIFVDEMLYLNEHGWQVFDAYRQETFTCYARLVFYMSDYRGLQKLTKLPGAPALMPCPRCWINGFKFAAKGKTIYPMYGCQLPPEHTLRRKAERLNRGDVRSAFFPPRAQSDVEVVTGAPIPLPDEDADVLRGAPGL